jgi:tryptophan synthase beta chain
MAAYDQYIAGNLQNYRVTDEDLKKSMADADALNK